MDVTISDVYVEEAQQIRIRRKAASFEAKVGETDKSPTNTSEKPPLAKSDQKPGVVDSSAATGSVTNSIEVRSSENELVGDAVGLALSGGGIRSASFNLGVIQALHRFGVLRFIDYLSSVSGGSYIAAAISHSVAKKKSYARDSFEFSDSSGGESVRASRLTARGNYLVRLDLFANRYITGLILNLIPMASLLIAIGAGIALVWRGFDSHFVRDRLTGLGFESDLAAALFPGALLLSCWLLLSMAALAFKSDPLRRACSPLFLIAIICLIIGCAVLIGNGDVTWNDDSGLEVRHTTQWFQLGLLLLTALGLVPLLQPQKLIRSGAAPKRFVDSWLFYYASFAMLIGIPLLVISFFARENVSGYGTMRGGRLDRGDLIAPDVFCDWLLDPYVTSGAISDLSFSVNEDLLPVPSESNEEGEEIDSPMDNDSIRATNKLNRLERSAAQYFFATILLDIARQELLGLPAWHAVESDPLGSNSTDSDQALALPRRCKACTHDRLTQYADDELKAALESAHYSSDLSTDVHYEDPGDAQQDAIVNRPWHEWRYFEGVRRWGSLGRYLMWERGDNRFHRFIERSEDVRRREDQFLYYVNNYVLLDPHLFQLCTDSPCALNPAIALGPSVSVSEEATAADAPTLTEDVSARYEEPPPPPETPLDNGGGANVDEKAETRFQIVHNRIDFSSDPIPGLSTAEQARLEQLFRKRVEVDRDGLSGEEILEMNRLMLQVLLPDVIRSRESVRRVTVLASDQLHRCIWFVGALIVFLVSSYLNNPNRTSLHEFYRERLASAFLDESDDAAGHPPMSLAECTPYSFGAPYPLIGASICEYSPWRHASQLDAPFSRFLLSPRFCGSELFGVARTSGENGFVPANELSVSDAMAISGAAITPTSFVHHIVNLVMSVLNLSTGKWMPNPRLGPVSELRPRLSSIWKDDFKPSTERRNLLISDGGHTDNLGLGVLLDRKCQIIIVSDCGHDPNLEFVDFSRIMRERRSSGDIEFFELDRVSPLRLDRHFKKARAKLRSKSSSGNHFACGLIRYAGSKQSDEEWGLLVYIKPVLCNDEAADTLTFARHKKEFPHQPTIDQAFDDEQFEAYRQVGFQSVVCMCRDASADEMWESKSFDIARLWEIFCGSAPQQMYSVGQDDTTQIVQIIEQHFSQLEGKDDEVVKNATMALEAFGESALAAIIPIVRHARSNTLTASDVAKRMLTDFGQEVVSALVEAIGEKSFALHDRTECARELVELLKTRNVDLGEDAVDSLTDIYDGETKPSLRNAIIRLLAYAENPLDSADDLLNKACNDSSPMVQATAIRIRTSRSAQ